MPLGRVPWGLIFRLHCLYSRVSRVSDANSTLGRSWGKSTARMTPAPLLSHWSIHSQTSGWGGDSQRQAPGLTKSWMLSKLEPRLFPW